jgi:hypothetical protein
MCTLIISSFLKFFHPYFSKLNLTIHLFIFNFFHWDVFHLSTKKSQLNNEGNFQTLLLIINKTKEGRQEVCEIAMQMSCDLTMAMMQKSRSYKPHDELYQHSLIYDLYTYMQTKIIDKNGVIMLIPFTKVVKIPLYPLFQGEAIVINDIIMVLWEFMYLVA